MIMVLAGGHRGLVKWGRRTMKGPHVDSQYPNVGQSDLIWRLDFRTTGAPSEEFGYEEGDLDLPGKTLALESLCTRDLCAVEWEVSCLTRVRHVR